MAGGRPKEGKNVYSRRIVTMLDRRGLQRCACECYKVSKWESDRLLGEPAEPEHARLILSLIADVR